MMLMMMALKEDSRYGLFSRDSLTAANITCIHVKLTDSALRFIEDSVKSNKSSRPTLEVNEDHGVFRIPLGTSQKDFEFTMSATSGDGSFDCIKQSKEGRLEALDTMTQKIVVKATDDVYQTTRDKLAVKNEESKKNCAKELDHTKGGIKPKRVIKTLKRNGNDHLHSSSQSAKPASSWNLSRSPNLAAPPTVGATSPPTVSTTSTAHTNNPYLTQVANSRTNAAKKLDKIKRRQQSKLNTAAKEAAVAHNKSNGVTKSEKEKAKAALLAVPLRERVIHLLAVRPNAYDTPNLLCKLKSDGINPGNEPSAHEISVILESIGSTNAKGCWFVRPEFYHEVDPNWSFYSETNKQLVKRTMNKASVKPIVTVRPTSDSRKRRLDEEDAELMKMKQQKATAAENIPDDFLRKYTKVTDGDQRNRYKEDFNREYQEYRNLYDYMEAINKKFLDLAEKLDATSHGSTEYQKVEKKIKKEYKSVSSSKEYLTNKPRLEYLHRKLDHIKKLVGDYDNALLSC